MGRDAIYRYNNDNNNNLSNNNTVEVDFFFLAFYKMVEFVKFLKIIVLSDIEFEFIRFTVLFSIYIYIYLHFISGAKVNALLVSGIEINKCMSVFDILFLIRFDIKVI